MGLTNIFGAAGSLYPNYNNAAGNTITINDDTDKYAMLISIPTSGTLYKILIPTGVITTGDSAFSVRLETIGTDGNPSGTLAYTNGSGTVNIADTDDSVLKECLINSTSGVSVTIGDMVYVVLNRSAGSSFAGNFRYGGQVNGATSQLISIRDYNITTGSAWTKAVYPPTIAVNIDNVWYCPSGCTIGKGVSSSVSYANPLEKGVGVYSPIPLLAVGVKAYISMAAASTFKFNLYSTPTGSPSLIASTNTIDSDSLVGTTSRYVELYFTTSQYLSNNTLYVLALAPLSSENATINYITLDIDYATASPTGKYSTLYSRSTGGTTSFTETNNNYPIIELLYSMVGMELNNFKGGNIK